MRSSSYVAVALALLALAGCSRTVGEGDPDIDAARSFDGYPLYWVGERFGEWDLERVALGPEAFREFTTFSYGTCEIGGPFQDHGCAVTLNIQIQLLCAHLEDVARAQIWRTRSIRGAPVGTIDSAPVMFTDRVQVKVYRGEGSYPGLALEALRALRSVNDVPPVVTAADRIPGASPAILSGAQPCSD